MNSRYPTADAPTTMLTSVKGAGTLRTRKTARVPLRFNPRRKPGNPLAAEVFDALSAQPAADRKASRCAGQASCHRVHGPEHRAERDTGCRNQQHDGEQREDDEGEHDRR